MLDHHPDLAIANDTHFIPRVLELTNSQSISDAVSGREIPLTTELVGATQHYHRFYRLNIDPITVQNVAERTRTYPQFVSGLFDAFARQNDKPLAGEKTPDYVRRLLVLKGLFPFAKFVHIVRDGRDVALSLRQWAKPDKGPGRLAYWKTDPIAVCGLWWKWLVEKGRGDARQLLPQDYLEITYEELVSSPSNCMNQITSFLNLPFAEGMLQCYEEKRTTKSKQSAKSAWLPPTPGLRNWRSELAPADIQLFETIAGTTLRQLGYECQENSADSSVTERARQAETWWRQEFQSRHKSHEPALH
jgi:hypothetical protein